MKHIANIAKLLLFGIAVGILAFVWTDRVGLAAPPAQSPVTLWSDNLSDTKQLRRMDRTQLRGGEIRLSHANDQGIALGFQKRVETLLWTAGGDLYGGAAPDGRLFQYNLATQSGVARGSGVGMSNLWSLAEGSDGKIYGGAGSGTVGYLISYDPISASLSVAGAPVSSTGSIPTAETDVMAIVNHANGLIYGGTAPNAYLFSFNPATGVFTGTTRPVPGETAIRALVVGPNGKIYGGTIPSGHLFEFDPATGAVSDKGVAVAGETQVRALAVGPDNKIYGGTAPNGHLFVYDPAGGTMTDKGRPVAGEEIITALATGPGGYVFGGTGLRGQLFAWDPGANGLVFSEQLVHGESQVTALAAGSNGKLYAGTGSSAHLVVYDPAAYQSQGEVTSAAVSLPYGMAWQAVNFTASTPSNTALTVDVLDGAGNVLLQDVSNGASLAAIDPLLHSRLKLRANLSTGSAGQSPALQGWSLSGTPMAAPQAAFSASPTAGLLPLTVSFTNVSTNVYTSTLWSFGDGLTSTLASPTHTYTLPGLYTVTLAVTGPGGSDIVTKTGYIDAYEPLQAGFSAAPTAGLAPLTTVFTNTSTGNYTSSLWDFGDGTTATQSSPSHTYSAAGVYTVALTVSGTQGSDTLAKPGLINVANSGYTIAGTITDTTGNPISGVTMSISPVPSTWWCGGAAIGSGYYTATTDVNGYYIVSGVPPGAYLQVPRKTGYEFQPTSLLACFDPSYNDPDAISQNFSGYLAYTITGKVTDQAGSPLANTWISYSNEATEFTDANGLYTITVPAGTYQLDPYLNSYVFNPLSRTVTMPPNAPGQDFVGTYSPLTLVDPLTLRTETGNWPPQEGQKLIAHIRVRNQSGQPLHIEHIGVRGRRNGTEFWDIGFWTIDLQSNQEWTLDPNNQRPLEPGNYTFQISYSLDGSTWIDLGSEISFTVAEPICNQVTEIPQAECNALLSLYSSTNGANWTDNSGWLVSSTPCSWYGVTCSGGHVSDLYLAGNNLNGSISPGISGLTNLSYLSLEYNQLTGTIPSELGSLINLQTLVLRDNQLSGNIPPEFNNLVKLKALFLDINQLSGSIPSGLDKLTNLRWLALSDNQLTGNIPLELGFLPNLANLELSNNQLTGNVPVELGKLSNLDYLYLDHNQFDGPLPNSLTNLTVLQNFWFDNTSLCEPYYVKTWLDTIQSVKRTNLDCANQPKIELIGLEVTQGIQDWKNSVVLIEDKPTYVRAHVRSLSGPVNGVTAVLHARRNGSELLNSPQRLANDGKSINVVASPDRNQLDDSFLFKLPPSWLNGTIELEVVGDNLAIGDCADIDNDCKVTVTFEKTPRLNLVLASVLWADGHYPEKEDIDALLREIEAVFPIPMYISPPPQITIQPPKLPYINVGIGDVQSVNWLLLKRRYLDDNCAPGFCSKIYLGILVDPDAANVTKHLGLANKKQSVASGWWFRSGQGLPVKNPKIPAEKLRGIVPHELGHVLLGGGHVRTPECGTLVTDPSWKDWEGWKGWASYVPYIFYRYNNGWISPVNGGNDALLGFHIYENEIYGPEAGDLMSYCFPVWPSDWTYEELHKEIKSRFQTSSQEIDSINGQAATSALLVSGTISPTQNTGNISTIYKVALDVAATPPVTGSYTLQIENEAGGALAAYPFDPEFNCDPLSGCPAEEIFGTFVLAVPDHSQAKQIHVLHNGQTIASKIASAQAPSISVTSPNGGETLSGSTAQVNWSAADSDGDPLEYIIQYSANGGADWQTLALDWTSTTFELNLDFLPGSDQGLIRVLASDGFHTAQDQSDATFSVARHPPQPFIQFPEDNDLYVSDQTIILDGRAFDNEDNQLADTAFHWSSSLDGSLGAGPDLAVNASTLTAGTHTITLTVTDSDAMTGTDQITVQVSRERPVFPAALTVVPGDFIFGAEEGSNQTDWQSFSIRNSGDGVLSWSATADQSWLKILTATGTAPSSINIAADPTGLPVGIYSGSVTLTASGAATSSLTIPITLNVVAKEQNRVYLPVLLKYQ